MRRHVKVSHSWRDAFWVIRYEAEPRKGYGISVFQRSSNMARVYKCNPIQNPAHATPLKLEAYITHN